MKFSVEKDDFITNPETHEQMLVIVKDSVLKLKDYLVGVPMILGGVAYLVIKAHKNGAKAYKYAEYETLEKLGLIK